MNTWASCEPYLPEWPTWTFHLLLVMVFALILATVLTRLVSLSTPPPPPQSVSSSGSPSSTSKLDDDALALKSSFQKFKNKYLVLYGIIMLADWMQGTHMYTLYLSYGVDIGSLFLTGFLSGAIFAPFLGSLVDRFGRKKSCIVYCVLEIGINILEHSPSFHTLLLGRILGGISTNLLFTAFESWMSTSHRHHNYKEEWLAITYSHCGVVNGSMAILAGIVAQLLEDHFGQIAPFQGAVALTVLALVIVCGWEENYGRAGEENEDVAASSTTEKTPTSVFSAIFSQFKSGWSATLSSNSIIRICLIQALSEGAMYTFVFLWVPTLLSLAPHNSVPTGAVFSGLMIAITIGGMMAPTFEHLLKSTERAATFTYLLAGVAMSIPALCISYGAAQPSSSSCFSSVLIAFVICEFTVGMFGPHAATIRAKHVPDEMQGAILNIFRLPLNVMVVLGTKLSDISSVSNAGLPLNELSILTGGGTSWSPYSAFRDWQNEGKIFWVVASWFILAGIIQGSMCTAATSAAVNTRASSEVVSTKTKKVESENKKPTNKKSVDFDGGEEKVINNSVGLAGGSPGRAGLRARKSVNKDI